MNKIYHKGLTRKYWFSKNIFEQMANIGAEIGRATNWRNKNKKDSQLALERAFELIDLTIEDPKNKIRLKEILRLREILADYFYGENEYKSTDKFFERYFYNFNYAARINS